MSQFTGGRVVFGRTIQPAQYESKKAEVELFFAVGEGEDHTEITDKAQLEAISRAHAMLGLTPSKPVGQSDKEALAAKKTGGETGVVETGKPTAGTEQTGEKKARTSKKAPPAPATDLTSMEPAGEAAGSKAAEKPAASGTAPAPSAASTPTDIMDEFAADAPVEITDKALADAMSKKNSEIKDTRRIKELVAKYGVARASELPQEKRAGFVTELNAMKPAAA